MKVDAQVSKLKNQIAQIAEKELLSGCKGLILIKFKHSKYEVYHIKGDDIKKLEV